MRETKEQLEERARIADEQSVILHRALNGILRGEVQWFRGGNQAVGVYKAEAPDGGIVLHSYAGYTCAYYWEHWSPGILEDYGTKNPDRIKLRALASMA